TIDGFHSCHFSGSLSASGKRSPSRTSFLGGLGVAIARPPARTVSADSKSSARRPENRLPPTLTPLTFQKTELARTSDLYAGSTHTRTSTALASLTSPDVSTLPIRTPR